MQLRFCLLLLLQACAETAEKPKKNVWKKSVGKGAASTKKNVAPNPSPSALPSLIQKAANVFASHTEKPRKIAKYYYKKASKEAAKLWKKFVNSGFSFEKLLATQIAAVLVYTIISSLVKSILRASKRRAENKLVKKVYVATSSHVAEGSANENDDELNNELAEEAAQEPVEQSADNSDDCPENDEPQEEIRRSRSTQINRRKSSSSAE